MRLSPPASLGTRVTGRPLAAVRVGSHLGFAYIVCGPYIAGSTALEPDNGDDLPQERSRVLKPAPPRTTPPSTPVPALQTGGTRIPLSVIMISVVVGAVVVALVWAVLPKQPAAPTTTSAADTVAAADTGLDVRWQKYRQDNRDCIGTFEVTRGGGTPAQFAAEVMDSAGRIIARDSVRVASTTRGVLVDLRFRRTACKAIADWQLQVTTPKVTPAEARD